MPQGGVQSPDLGSEKSENKINVYIFNISNWSKAVIYKQNPIGICPNYNTRKYQIFQRVTKRQT